MAGRMGGEERRKEDGMYGEEGAEKGNGHLIPIRATMDIWAGDLFISSFLLNVEVRYLMFKLRNQK